MNDTDYKIIAISGIEPSKYPESKKYKFMLEGVDGEVSTFSKFPMSVGQSIFGHIEEKGQWKNFKWGKKETKTEGFPPSMPELKNLINLRVLPLLIENNAILKEIAKQKGVDLKGIVKDAYPEYDETNNASPF